MMKLKTILVWLSGALLTAGAWQLEIVKLRAIHGEQFSLPFFLVTSGNFTLFGLLFLSLIGISYIFLFLATQFSWESKRPKKPKFDMRNRCLTALSIVLFSVAFFQLVTLSINTINFKPYYPPFIQLETTELKALDMGDTSLSPVYHVSFWGDVWIIIIISSYAILFLGMRKKRAQK